jgi:pyridoxal 5'-phosphate synthase pdxS subunit
MALERVPADIRATGGVARMSDPKMIEEIMDAVTIPVMAKARIGHFVEARVLEALGVDYIDESEVLTPADEQFPHREARLQGAVRVRRARSR